ncbi:MAG: efflux RND transporter permease subunit [Planctomycetes bacterium]|nr:efflux RND transporter permease subunit [Planctomycetota bacterium]
MNPVRFSVERPHTIAVAGILAVLFSWLAFRSIPVQLKPTVDTPIITIETIYLGASAGEVEEQVTRPIEDVVQNCEGVEKLRSTSTEGYSAVSLEYNWGVDKNASLVDVMNKLAEMPPLPDEAEQPIVSLVPPMQREAAMWLVSRSPYDPSRVRQIVEDQVAPQLKRVPGVGGLLVFGGEEREIQVRLDPDRMAGFAVRFDEVAEALTREHVNLRGGTIETATRQMVVRTEGKATLPAEIGAIVVRRDERATIRLDDVAVIADTYRERSSFVKGDGQENVALGVNRQAGANVVELIEACDVELAAINRRLADQGLDLRFESVYRDTTYLNEALEFVTGNLVVGALLAIAVLLIFLRSFRSVLVICVAIPVSLVMVFLVMQALGRTLNVISLAGLAFASGMVVDNAIVVLENFFRHKSMGKRAVDAAIEGGREVWGGVLASTLTTMAVFLPILGVEEEAGQLFADLAITIASAVAFSLVVALLAVPPLCSLLWRGKRALATKAEAGAPGWMERLYGFFIAPLTRAGFAGGCHRFGLVLAITAASLVTLHFIPAPSYLPSGNSNFIFFFAQPTPGQRMERIAENMGQVERWVSAQPESAVCFSVASSNFNGGGIILKPEYANGAALDAYVAKMMPVCFTTPGFNFMLPVRFSLFNDPGSQFEVQISGAELPVLDAAAQQLTGALMGVDGVAFARSGYVEGRPELLVKVDPHKATEQGMTVAQVGAVVEMALAGRRVSLFSAGGRDYDVNAVVPQERVRSEEELRALPVVTPAGATTTLGDLALIERRRGPVSIDRLERQRTITLTVNLKPGVALGDVLARAEQQVLRPAQAQLPPGYSIEFGGSADKLTLTLAALTRSFWLAILITYLLLVALFRSWLSPLVIMVTVPLAMGGGVAAIAIAQRFLPNASFDVITMLGFIILAGIVVNNAILIVHQANNFRDEGMERRRALQESAKSRLRPIVMTVLTTVCGLLPLAFGSGAGSELYQGLGIVMLGGLVVSTLFTLFLVPALLALGWDVAEAFGGRDRWSEQKAAATGAAAGATSG